MAEEEIPTKPYLIEGGRFLVEPGKGEWKLTDLSGRGSFLFRTMLKFDTVVRGPGHAERKARRVLRAEAKEGLAPLDPQRWLRPPRRKRRVPTDPPYFDPDDDYDFD